MTTLVLVTGSRHATAEQHGMAIEKHLLVVTADLPAPYTLWHGAAPGADTLAGLAAGHLGWQVETIPADWTGPCRPGCGPAHRRQRRDGTTYCPVAGHYRNQQMVDTVAAGLPNAVCAAFPLPDSRGTRDCVRRARKAGIPVHLHPLGVTP